MTWPIKLFFDECLCKQLPKKFKELYSEDYPLLETKHLTDIFLAGAKDQEWVASLDDNWIVITADAGVKAKQKLPIICAERGISHVVVSSSLHHLPYREQKQAFLSVWPMLIQMPLLPKGTRACLCLHKQHEIPMPYLMIDSKPFYRWCREKGVVFERIPYAPPGQVRFTPQTQTVHASPQ